MTDREAIKSLIENAYEARRTGNIEAIMAAFDPNCTFEIVGAKPLAKAAGRVEGHAQLRNALAPLIDAFKFEEREFISMIIENDRAAVHSRVKVLFVPNGKTEITEIVDLWKIQNARIVELIEFIDTALVNEMMR